MELRFHYKNHRGELSDRVVSDAALVFMHKPDFGYQPGWFIKGVCAEKQAIRCFALTNIILPAHVDTYFLVPDEYWGDS